MTDRTHWITKKAVPNAVKLSPPDGDAWVNMTRLQILYELYRLYNDLGGLIHVLLDNR